MTVSPTPSASTCVSFASPPRALKSVGVPSLPVHRVTQCAFVLAYFFVLCCSEVRLAVLLMFWICAAALPDVFTCVASDPRPSLDPLGPFVFLTLVIIAGLIRLYLQSLHSAPKPVSNV